MNKDKLKKLFFSMADPKDKLDFVVKQFGARLDKLENYPLPKMGLKGDKGDSGPAGKDGSPESGEEIVIKINSLDTVPDHQIDFVHIKNFPWHLTKGDRQGNSLISWGNPLTVEEIDGSPSVSNVTGLIFSNGSVTDNGDGTVTVTTGGGGFTNLTEFVSQTAWRIFYSNGSGDVIELALGTAGTFLQANGVAAAPTWSTPAGSGDVTKVGTPVDNQIGVWTGDGTIEGDADFLWSGSILTVTNTTDSASVQSAIFQGDRATMADGDEAYISFKLSDDGGTQKELVRLVWIATDVNAGTNVDGRLVFHVMTAGTLATELQLDGVNLAPGTGDGLALGNAVDMWSDLFLASGAVIDFNADITITHSADTLTFAGGTIVLGTATATGGLTGNVTGNVSGTAATVTGAAQTAITSLGILTALDVDNININGNTISSTAGTDLLITPLAGQQLILDGTIEIDAGVVTGATSITSTTFVGALTGNASTASSAAILTTARTIGGVSFDGSANITVASATGGFAISGGNLTVTGSLQSGAAAGTNGQLTLTGSTSGTGVIKVNVTAGAGIVFQIPSANGSANNLLLTDGAGVTSWTNALVAKTVTTSLTPTSNDGAALGAASTGEFSDLFLAEGGIINWDNGDATITQTGNDITIAGITTFGVGTSTAVTLGTIELGAASDTTIARVSAGVVSIEGVNILTVAGGTLTGVITLGENTSIALDPAGSADGKYSGVTVTGTGGATIAFGDLVTLDKDDSRWELVDISVAAAATGDARGVLGIAVTSSTDGGAITVLLQGIVRADANFPALTIGAPVYASTTGDIVVTQPTTTDHVIRQVGFAMTADELFFSPTQTWVSHT